MLVVAIRTVLENRNSVEHMTSTVVTRTIVGLAAQTAVTRLCSNSTTSVDR